MSEEPTQDMPGGRSFEERVFLRFDALDASISEVTGRVQQLEARSYDTRPIWERALKEIVETRRELTETRRELKETRRELSKRLTRVEAVVYEVRSNLSEMEDRVEELENSKQ
jgi:septal ring factor EnvC (AmiA/AmiB activator)